MMKHTPGPWTVVPAEKPFGEWIFIATCAADDDANARLIASAPDLLTALQAMIAPFASMSDDDLRAYPDTPQPQAILAARAAIKKATEA